MLRAITDRMSLAGGGQECSMSVTHIPGAVQSLDKIVGDVAALKAGEVDHVSVTRKLPPKSNTGRSFAKLLP